MNLNREHPGNLPVLPTGLHAGDVQFGGPESFRDDVKRITDQAGLGENLDLAMAGQSSPRIWLFLHEPGQASLSAVAALAMARRLGERDQAVLLLDGDDQASLLTRWVGRHEEEGWIDMVRYGASVLTSGTPLPFGGRRGYVIGVGSFTPIDVETSEAEDLVLRLRRQADDLIVVAPLGPLGRMWAVLADIRLLCWDADQGNAAAVEAVSAEFEAAGHMLTGLVAYGEPAGPVGIAEKPAEPETEAPVDAGAEAEPDTASHDFDSDPSPVDVLQATLPPGVTYPEDEEIHQEEGDLFAVAGAADSGRGSSRFFWGVAVVALAVIVVVSVFYWNQVRQPGVGDGAETVQVAQADQPGYSGLPAGAASAGSPRGPEGEMSGGDSPGDTENPSVQPSAEAGPAEGVNRGLDQEPGTGHQVDSAQLLGAATGPRDPQNELEKDEPVKDEPVAGGERQAAGESPAAPVVSPEATATPAFVMDPYEDPVGQAGWALHVYSFSDSVSAARECRMLKRRGFQTATRPVQLKEKGRWYRVYVGSFATKSAALAARDPLAAKLRLDYVRPTEF